MNILVWLQDWYKCQCDGDWQHLYGIKIESIDNPGWKVEIDLSETIYSDLSKEYTLQDDSEDDWIAYQVHNERFIGYGDPSKLEAILSKFRELVE